MSDTPQKPREGEVILPEGTGPAQMAPKWETVPGAAPPGAGPSAWTPPPAPSWLPPATPAPSAPAAQEYPSPATGGAGPIAGGYTNLQGSSTASGAPVNGGPGYLPPPPLPPPAYPQAAPPPGAGSGYQPVFGGSPAAAPPPPGYGVPPAGAPPGYGQGGYGQQGYPPQYPQGYPQQFPQQGNYGTNVAEMLAVGALMTGVGVQRRRWRRKHLIFWPLMLVLFLGLMLVRGCLGFLHLVGDAGKPEIHALHDRMAENDLDGIYSSADAGWRTSETRTQSDALFAAVYRQMGAPVNYSVRSVSINSESGTKEIVAATVFSRGKGIESLRFHKSGGEYKLQNYELESPSFRFDTAGREETF